MSDPTTSASATTSTTTSSTNSIVVNVVVSTTTLLSGGLNDCHDGMNDPTCSGGVALIHAYLRKYGSTSISSASASSSSDGNIIIQQYDYQSVFVQMHPLGWNVNRFILHDYYSYEYFYAQPSLLDSHYVDSTISVRDLSGLQTYSFRPLLHGNIIPSTSNSWYQYTKNIQFDYKTGIAIIIVHDHPIVLHKDELNSDSSSTSESFYTISPEIAAQSLLSHIHQENVKRKQCHIGTTGRSNGGAETTTTTLYEDYILQRQRNPNVTTIINSNDDTNNVDSGDGGDDNFSCWIPILIKTNSGISFEDFLQQVYKFEHLPSFVFGTFDSVHREPQLIQVVANNNNVTGISSSSNDLWIASYESNPNTMRQFRITINENENQEQSSLSSSRRVISNITLLEHDLNNIDNTTKDYILQQDLQYMSSLAKEAQEYDPIEGLSLKMPQARNEEGTIRMCYAGECPIGNLYADALKWYTSANFAFLNSGGIRGQGWKEGPVKVSDIWSSLPFANTQCTGVISGVTIFRIFDLSTSEAIFVADALPNGDRLFQVSGIRYSYNTELDAPRLVKLEIYDEEVDDYVPVERLKLYKYATESWMCSGVHPIPSILSDELAIKGEQPKEIGDQLLQDIVGEYLSFAHTEVPFDTSIQGRITNDTSATEVLNYVQTEASCTSSTYWVEEYKTCFDCPSTANNVFLTARERNFMGVSGVNELFESSADIVNGAEFPISVVLKSKPNWVVLLSEGIERNGQSQSIIVPPGGSFYFDFATTAEDLQAGLATGALSFALLDGGNFPGCVGRDLFFELSLDISKAPELFQTGSIRIVGYTMVGVIILTSLACAVWVHMKREAKAVKAAQPAFLFAICFGVVIIGMSILTVSLQGSGSFSESGENMVCMATAWLISMGFSFVMSALLAKLWRINKVVSGARAFRRTNVSVKRAVLNFSVQFLVNFILMLAWSLVQPMEYHIKSVEDEVWKQYGTCKNVGVAGWTFMGLTIGINYCILLLAVYEAYKARNLGEELGEEYNETLGLGLTIFSWLQLLIVVIPVLFLIEEDSANPRYFLKVSLIFACCMSMLLFINVPLVMKVWKSGQPTIQNRLSGGTRVWGSANNIMRSFRNLRTSSMFRPSTAATTAGATDGGGGSSTRPSPEQQDGFDSGLHRQENLKGVEEAAVDMVSRGEPIMGDSSASKSAADNTEVIDA